MEFWKSLGVALVVVALASGFIYWIFFFFKKVLPDLKYSLKYKVLRAKYNEAEVEKLMDYLQANLSSDQVFKFLLLNGIDFKRAKELRYIYKQMGKIQLKGGDQSGR